MTKKHKNKHNNNNGRAHFLPRPRADCNGFAMVSQWVCHGFSMVFSWVLHGAQHGFSMGGGGGDGDGHGFVMGCGGGVRWVGRTLVWGEGGNKRKSSQQCLPTSKEF